jgi:hypothetical protein
MGDTMMILVANLFDTNSDEANEKFLAFLHGNPKKHSEKRNSLEKFSQEAMRALTRP